MAININFTNNGCSAYAWHDEEAEPRFKGEFTLSSSLQLSVTFKDPYEEEGRAGNFNFDVGFVAEGANGKTHSGSGRLSFGTLSSGSYGYGNDVNLSANLSDLTFPITLYFTCQGCDWYVTGNYNMARWLNDKNEDTATWSIKDARDTHTHIDKPDPPTISSTTGKTITVKGGKDGIYCTTNDDGWYNTPHKFENLKQGTSYRFKCREYCPECPDDKVLESSAVTGKTWTISGEYIDSGVNSMTFKATHTAGTVGTASGHSITYKLYKSKSTSGTPVDTKTGKNGVPITFTGLESNKTYYCYAYTNDLGNGDNNCWITSGSTLKPPTSEGSGNVSATTLRASVSWNAAGAKSVTCTVECNGQGRTLSNSGGYVGFSGLTPGATYTVTWRVITIYEYTYTYEVENEDGEIEQKTGVKNEKIETTGSASYTTKKAKFGSPINTSSKIVQFKSSSNYSSDVMEQRIYSTGWDIVGQDTYQIYDNLTHNTTYTIYARIRGCFAFNSSGEVTDMNDSEISTTASTKLLSLRGSVVEEHQHSLITLWQAYVDGNATDSDSIDGELFTFTDMGTIARKNNPPYQSAEVIEGLDGDITGNYKTDKKIYSVGLTWYYCEYIVQASITDGHNIVSGSVIAHTIFPSSWIYTGGRWHKAMPYVYTNNQWVPAPIFVYSNGKYNEPNGE